MYLPALPIASWILACTSLLLQAHLVWNKQTNSFFLFFPSRESCSRYFRTNISDARNLLPLHPLPSSNRVFTNYYNQPAFPSQTAWESVASINFLFGYYFTARTKTYTTRRLTTVGQVSLWGRGELESPSPIRVHMLSLCIVRWETTIASAQISRRGNFQRVFLSWLMIYKL